MANRKYLSRDENKSKPADSDAPKKEIFLEKTQAKGSTNGNLEGIGGDIKNVNEYINSLNKHILDQRTRI